ncbi:UNVERIFIED_CONTAM: hypothetical protein HDU68_012572 [Siphonaria sp. JEL0065]|nr:hypothetical protein HDU68_012572 [Siphonaria sp. JEL0065]
MSILYKTYYSDTACSQAVRISYPSLSCENIRLDTSCLQDASHPGVYTKSGCTSKDGLLTLGDTTFGTVPQLQYFYNPLLSNAPECVARATSPSYSFQYPLNKCVPNYDNNTMPYRDGPTTILSFPFTHEMATEVNGVRNKDIVVARFNESTCTTTDMTSRYKDLIGTELNPPSPSNCSSYSLIHPLSPAFAIDSYYDSQHNLGSISIYRLDSCIPTAVNNTMKWSYDAPQRTCAFEDVPMVWRNSGYLSILNELTITNKPSITFRKGDNCDLTAGYLSNYTSVFAAAVDKCVPTGVNGTFSISTIKTAENKTQYVNTTLFSTSACAGNPLSYTVYEVGQNLAAGPCVNGVQVDYVAKSNSSVLQTGYGLFALFLGLFV